MVTLTEVMITVTPMEPTAMAIRITIIATNTLMRVMITVTLMKSISIAMTTKRRLANNMTPTFMVIQTKSIVIDMTIATDMNNPDPSPYSSVPPTPSKPVHSHSHASEVAPHHHHGHGNENMHGIYLHILADTLGSAAVVVSTVLIHFYGWSGFDPLASCLIAILIFASAIPLVKSSAKTLLLTVPEDTEFDLREALAGVSALKGVVGYAAPKFWLAEGDERKVLGVIHVTAARGTDMEDVKERAVAYLRSKHMDVLVQVERDGMNRCWCKTKAG
ncbi:MAG: hypothetical protein Q9172_007153 [Xanthocarpia lactea]